MDNKITCNLDIYNKVVKVALHPILSS